MRGRLRDGFTLMELLIVVAIIVVLAVIFLLVNWRHQIDRAHDARRKADLAAILRAMEEYYNDKSCYPALTFIDTCGSTDFAPYLPTIPCDPVSREPYRYIPDSDTNLCGGNRVCAKLRNASDPDIAEFGCHPANGCGWGAGWNYCLANGTTVTAPGFDPGAGTPTPTPTPPGGGAPTSTPTPTPTPGGGAPTPTPTVTPTQLPSPSPTSGPGYACTPGGDCNMYANPQGAGCPVWWQSGCPAGACADPANRCAF